jgi:hypothetical protein
MIQIVKQEKNLLIIIISLNQIIIKALISCLSSKRHWDLSRSLGERSSGEISRPSLRTSSSLSVRNQIEPHDLVGKRPHESKLKNAKSQVTSEITSKDIAGVLV